MSWLRNAVKKAVEVTGGNAVSRTVWSYADTVVNHVSGGDKIVDDPLLFQSQKSFRQTLKSLEENAVSCRGLERNQLLKRWLISLKKSKGVEEVPVFDANMEDAPAFSQTKDSLVFTFDSGEYMNFWNVFLHSQALEGLILSMILEPPSQEEIYLMQEIFGVCLMGGKEIHQEILSSIQDLGRSFSSFQDEVLVKREEMLQFAQCAVQGLKISADVARIDAEASLLRQNIDYLIKQMMSPEDALGMKLDKSTPADLEDLCNFPVSICAWNRQALKEALAEIRLCSKLEALLLEKKSIQIGDSPEIHFQKIDKLKVLSESLASCSMKAEKRISDHRHQKEEAVYFRVAKAKEVIEYEKELQSEISVLEKQRDDIEAELKKVNASLEIAGSRLKKTREERDKFDEASNEILMHLKIKEDDLLRSVESCKVEADVVQTWINFLEDTWLLQSSITEQNEKQMDSELKKCDKCIVKMIDHHILACKDELGSLVDQIITSACHLKDFSERSDMVASSDTSTLAMDRNSKKFLEEYLEFEAKILSLFAVTDEMKALLGDRPKDISRGDILEVTKIFDDIDRMKEQFRSIDRPTLDIETIPVTPVAPAVEMLQRTLSNPPWKLSSFKSKDVNSSQSAVVMAYNQLDPEAALAKLEVEFHRDSKSSSMEEIIGWEFDGV